MDMLNLITKLLLIVLLILQIGVMLYLFYVNHKRFEEDKKFWKKLDEEIALSKQRFQLELSECVEDKNENKKSQ